SHRAESLAERVARQKRPSVFSRPLRLAGDRAKVSRDVRAPFEGTVDADLRAAAWLVRPAADGLSAGRADRRHTAEGPRARTGIRRGAQTRVTARIHQVLATLGYGDAIGHEVLGIQRVLRAAGYESDIFVETADPRLEWMTRHYRELLDATHPDNLLLHHFSIGSKASRTAYALPDR